LALESDVADLVSLRNTDRVSRAILQPTRGAPRDERVGDSHGQLSFGQGADAMRLKRAILVVTVFAIVGIAIGAIADDRKRAKPSTDLADFAPFAKAIGKADKPVLLEGLPDKLQQAQLVLKERKEKRTIDVEGASFYAEPTVLQPDDASIVTKVLTDSANIEEVDFLSSVGFHPDYCITWQDGESQIRCQVSLAGGVLQFYNGDHSVECKLGGRAKARDQLETLLVRYRKQRPEGSFVPRSLDNFGPLAAIIKGAGMPMLSEGLPDELHEKTAFEIAQKIAKTANSRGAALYSAPIELRIDDASTLVKMLADSSFIQQYHGRAPFHADYNLSWQAGDERLDCQIDLRRGRLRYFSPKQSLCCDLAGDGKTRDRIETLLVAYHKQRPEGSYVPTSLENFEPLAASIKKAGIPALHEGLPNEFYEEPLYQSEMKTAKTMSLRAACFYAAPLKLRAADADALATILSDRKSIRRKDIAWRFHADYCVTWQAGDERVDCQIDLRSGAVRIYGAKNSLDCDLAGDGSVKEALEKVFFAYRKHRPLGKEPSTVLANFGPLVEIIRKADKMTLYEGLPHQYWEASKLKSELNEKKTVEYHDFPFYAEPLILRKEDADWLTKALTDSKTIERHYEEHLCGGFHPDYCIEWQAGNDKVLCQVCLGCAELQLFGPKNNLHCDLEQDAYTSLKKLLAPYRKQRPECE
jgi:hypothetical protein